MQREGAPGGNRGPVTVLPVTREQGKGIQRCSAKMICGCGISNSTFQSRLNLSFIT
jgi:hypothetical protein